jgi:uncharacterized damage-inducible protein DinB
MARSVRASLCPECAANLTRRPSGSLAARVGYFSTAGSPFLTAVDDKRKANANMKTIIENYHADAVRSFRNYKKLAERAIDQVSDDEFFACIDDEANSIAVIVKHIAGNMRSRWADFLTSDGEKPDRDRDTEFEMIADTRESLMSYWDASWRTLFDNVEPLTVGDFARSVTIRGEPHTIAEAINRQMTHYAYHVGQIVLLAKHFRSSDWKSLSIPKNRSADFNKFLSDKQDEGNEKTDRMDASVEFTEKK